MKMFIRLSIAAALAFAFWLGVFSFGDQYAEGIVVSTMSPVWSRSDAGDQIARLVIRNDTGNDIEIMGDTAC
ncbi:hypothetical protein N9B31_06620 [Mariniblastus sp.]|nr:hypothetical protein [Mariniblastus sp.]MDB4481134.1 hypothetical protein [bacterium]